MPAGHRTTARLLATSALAVALSAAPVLSPPHAQAPAEHLLISLHEPFAPQPVLAAPAPAARPAPTPAASRERPLRQPLPRSHQVRGAASPAFEALLQQQVRRLWHYRPGLARWQVWPGLPSYALTDRTRGIVYVNPRTPRPLLFAVVAHEWGHVVSTSGYGGDLAAADRAVLRWYGGGSPAVAIERAADCVARLLGARWTHYTTCTDARWRLGARYLAVGWPLPS